MVMIRKLIFMNAADWKELEKLNDKLNTEEDTELKMSARTRQILKRYIKENKQ